jgi:hypothetical protein
MTDLQSSTGTVWSTDAWTRQGGLVIELDNFWETQDLWKIQIQNKYDDLDVLAGSPLAVA